MFVLSSVCRGSGLCVPSLLNGVWYVQIVDVLVAHLFQ